MTVRRFNDEKVDGKITFDEFHAYFNEKVGQIAEFEKRMEERARDARPRE